MGRAGRRRPALNFSAQVLIFSTAVIPVPRTDGADPQFANPIDYIFSQPVPLPLRDRPAPVGRQGRRDGIGWAGLGRIRCGFFSCPGLVPAGRRIHTQCEA